MKKNLYIGEFPPPIGGVSIKNELLKNEIYNNGTIQFIDLYVVKRNPLKLIEFIGLILNSHYIVLGIGSNKRLFTLLKIVKLLKGSRALCNCSVIMMGSTLQEYCKIQTKECELLKLVKCVYTESPRINEQFARIGIEHTGFFPNCRVIRNTFDSFKTWDGKKLKLLFFSKVCHEKGAHILFLVLDKLIALGINVTLDYYGVIDSSYEAEFKNELKKRNNICEYCGVFDASQKDVYSKLREYDVLVFPSTWKGEGVPGVLVESKIAGIPAIVSEHNYNSEVIIDGIEGKVIKGDLIEGFTNAVLEIYQDKLTYTKLAKGAFLSRKRYDIEMYKNDLQLLLK